MKKNLFILKVTIAGPSGSGKSTLVRLLTDWLTANGVEFRQRSRKESWYLTKAKPGSYTLAMTRVDIQERLTVPRVRKVRQ
ncbi:hypothetical protein LBMAG56_49460 [Verrucomicrobiota bacterium]|nr:hypothetical protein LBMAG56_49460 [Verrucomicrobiota bacterium]